MQSPSIKINAYQWVSSFAFQLCSKAHLQIPSMYVLRHRESCMFFTARMHWVEGCYHTALYGLHLADSHTLVQNMFSCCCRSLKYYVRRRDTEPFPIHMIPHWRAGAPHSHVGTLLLGSPTSSILTSSSTSFLLTLGRKKGGPLTQFPQSCTYGVCIYKGCTWRCSLLG